MSSNSPNIQIGVVQVVSIITENAQQPLPKGKSLPFDADKDPAHTHEASPTSQVEQANKVKDCCILL